MKESQSRSLEQSLTIAKISLHCILKYFFGEICKKSKRVFLLREVPYNSELFSLCIPTIQKPLHLELKLLLTGDRRYRVLFHKASHLLILYRTN